MLLFDFDGVLIDSIDEVTVSAYNTATNRLKTALSQLPAELVDLYQKNRFHVQPAGDQPLLMAWCIENYRTFPGKLLTKREYRNIIQTCEIPLSERTRRFYAIRREFIEKQKEKWLALHSPFQPIWNELISRGAHRIVILTNKNRESLSILCRHHGLDIPDKNIYSGDSGASKTGNLDQIHKRFACRRYDFIDDSLNNLRDLDYSANRREKRFFPILAAWGYIGPENKRQARAYGYRVYQQSDLIADLDSHLLPLET